MLGETDVKLVDRERATMPRMPMSGEGMKVWRRKAPQQVWKRIYV